MKITRINPPEASSRGEVTRIVTVEGPSKLVWLSSQKPQGDDMRCVAPGDFNAQYEFVMDRLQLQLEAIGATWNDVVVRKMYLVDVEGYHAYCRHPEKKAYFDKPPCGSAIGVTRLSHPDFLVEIELVVAMPSEGA